MTLLLVILVVLLLCGGGWGYSTGHVTWGNPAGIILFVLLLLVVVGLVGSGSGLGWHRLW